MDEFPILRTMQSTLTANGELADSSQQLLALRLEIRITSCHV
jgi:hypothetical protein